MIPYFDNLPEEKLIKQFKQVCVFEFVTCILLYLIAMPIKYEWDIWIQMIPIGSLHGFAFTWYLILFYYVRKPLKWDDEDAMFAFLAAFFPFATLWVEKRLIKDHKK
ncbi:DUF3817 domain-containing protein [Flavobacteriaceae bacterium Ap0902]|nr:DUF3817 domain-containing protein [Flavobacteriaceae bacterium Ap0902]